MHSELHCPKLTALDPENEWLEKDPFLLGSGLFSGAMSLVLGRVAPNVSKGHEGHVQTCSDI